MTPLLRDKISIKTREAYADVNNAKKMRKHHEYLEGLPPKVSYEHRNGIHSHYRYRLRYKGKTIIKKIFTLSHYNNSYDECKAAIIEYVNSLNVQDILDKHIAQLAQNNPN